MVNCYIHPEKPASNSCVVCGREICRECSNWAAGDIYLCPKCWQLNAPEPTPEGRKGRVTTSSTSAGLSRALYYATAIIIVVIGSLYVYTTFVAPTILPSGGVPPVVSGSASSWLGEILSRNRLMIMVSVSTFLVVLIGGEWMLRTGPKEPRTVATQPQAQQLTQSTRTVPKPGQSVVRRPDVKPMTQILRAGPQPPREVVTQPQVQSLTPSTRASPIQHQSVATRPEVQPLTQTLPAGPKQSQETVNQSGVQLPTQTKFVYCIYCGNKIRSTALFCDGCGKGQR